MNVVRRIADRLLGVLAIFPLSVLAFAWAFGFISARQFLDFAERVYRLLGLVVWGDR